MADEIRNLAEHSSVLLEDIDVQIGEITSGFGVIQSGITGAKVKLDVQDTVVRKNIDSISSLDLSLNEMMGAEDVISYNFRNTVSSSENLKKIVSNSKVDLNTSIETVASLENKKAEIVESTELLNGAVLSIEDGNKILTFIAESIEKTLDDSMLTLLKQIDEYIAINGDDKDHLSKLFEKTKGVDIFLVNKKAQITKSNLDGYEGFQFSEDPNHQTYEFTMMIKRNLVHHIQRITKRDIDGQYCKIAGFKRTDDNGIIQICVCLKDLIDINLNEIANNINK